MMTKKIKVFLGGYLNFVNAQNLNCLALARHLDKEKFEIYSMLHPGGSMEYASIDGVKIFKCWSPMRLCRYLANLWGIWKAEVAYLPKGELIAFNRFLLKLFKKKSFVTVEGVITGTNYDKAIAMHSSKEEILRAYSFADKTYSITQHMAIQNDSKLHIHSDDVLYLGVESEMFLASERKLILLNELIFIGNNMRYKGIEEYLQLAADFPDLLFHVVGSGLGHYDLGAEIVGRNLKNVINHGELKPAEIATLLKRVQLHFLPSRSEGFPKAILEIAAAGVPSIVYDDYGASEWIASGENGFVVSYYQNVKAIIADLLRNSAELQRLSVNAVRLGKSFDWKIRVKDWEKVIEDLSNPNITNK